MDNALVIFWIALIVCWSGWALSKIGNLFSIEEEDLY